MVNHVNDASNVASCTHVLTIVMAVAAVSLLCPQHKDCAGIGCGQVKCMSIMHAVPHVESWDVICSEFRSA